MPYHVVTEMWFANTEDRDACYKGCPRPMRSARSSGRGKDVCAGGKFSTLVLEVDSNVESKAVDRRAIDT